MMMTNIKLLINLIIKKKVYTILIIILPLISFILLLFFGRMAGKRASSMFSVASLSFVTLLSYYSAYNYSLTGLKTHYVLGKWIDCGLFEVNWGFLFDSLSLTMFVVVSTVSVSVNLYSVYYMSEEQHFIRFMSYLSFFTFFMLVLVSADNLILFFLGWEGVGICSYLLIGFWHHRVKAGKAALKALIMNRFGDLGLTIAILAIFANYRALDFPTIFELTPQFSEALVHIGLPNYPIYSFKIVEAISLLLFIGAMGKSAQIGLHTWLPDAMEGPTPVSALIHAATMVTAGVFLIIRCSPIFEYAPNVLTFMSFVGAITCFFAGSVALVQYDIKKIIAYSTCSQLGYMVFACGQSAYPESFLHLTNHAFFKALLFLSAGAVIHSLGGEQDIRKMGGLAKVLPFTYVMTLIGSLALTGFPFLSGFYSKDLILEIAFSKQTFTGYFCFWLGSITAFFTGFYSFRLIYYVFFNQTNARKAVISKVHEIPIGMAIPLIILCLGSIFSASLVYDLMVEPSSTFFSGDILVLEENKPKLIENKVSIYIKLVPNILAILGSVLAIILPKWRFTFLDKYYSKQIISNRFSQKPSANKKKDYVWLFLAFRRLKSFLLHGWGFNDLYNKLIGYPFMKYVKDIYLFIDKGLLEKLGPNGIVNTLKRISRSINKLQTGNIYDYAAISLYVFVFIVILILLFV